MKMLRFFAVLLTVLSVLFVNSCSDDSSTNNPIDLDNYKFSCTLNGGGFSNQSINFTITGGAIYNPDENQTGVVYSNANQDAGSIVFKGKSTGTFKIEADDDTNLVVITLGGTQAIGLTSGTITVTSYGSVGGNVSGTFSGTGVVAPSGQVVQVSNGVFNAKRLM